MADAHSGLEAENGGTDSASVAPSNLAALQLRHLERLVETEDWQKPDTSDFHERFLAGQYHFPEAVIRELPALKPPERATSSMAVSIATTQSSAFVSSRSVAYTPSLVSYSTRRSDQSVRTSRADSILVFDVLDEDAEGADEPVNNRAQRVLPCSFSFLACDFKSSNLEQWDTHCKSHFYERLPRSIDCPFRCAWTWEAATGEQAWQARIVHIWSEHRHHGVVDTSRRPSGSFIQHLWKEGIIDNAQLKELRANGRLTGSQIFLRSAGPVREDRIRRHPRVPVRA